MRDDVLSNIERLYSKGDFQYILAKYVDKQYWISKFKEKLEEVFVDNLTDFSYSTCFSYFIQSSLNPKLRLGSDEFNDYLKKNFEIKGVMVLISVIAPYSVVKYVRYHYNDKAIQLHEDYSPLDKETKRIGKCILELLNKKGIMNLDETVLNVGVPNISLELREEGVTIYNCLFEDSY
ncbi:hypothetical protein [Paenibacillus popilliae]|uniref:Highly conserved protein n=1 Tax=Paenibacillus popilliae ATCC 14706 TaxID=1212764 RepID=M9M3K5_PAEPP|nr:hypothetical protein [Paenibacillus popilliae]GAC43599.1 highly conserved protein [Paenibacillus popilliae ATCC 14706]